MTGTSPIRAETLDNVSAFMEAVGLQLTQLGADRVEGFIELGPQHHQPWGIVHGGVYAAAIESAASIGAAMAAAEQGLVPVGVNNNTNFVRPMAGGRAKVVAAPIQQGRTQQLWEVRVSDEDDRLVAIGHVRLQNIAPRSDRPGISAVGPPAHSDAAPQPGTVP
jgi:1,4-dihydroxy-2-naphthoyl-CoA hydrolase